MGEVKDHDEILKEINEFIERSEKESTVDTSHYSRLNPSPKEVIARYAMGFFLGNVIKYLARAGEKKGQSEKDDLFKSMDYIKFEIRDSIQSRIRMKVTRPFPDFDDFWPDVKHREIVIALLNFVEKRESTLIHIYHMIEQEYNKLVEL